MKFERESRLQLPASKWWAPNNWREVRRSWESACYSSGVDISVPEEASRSNMTAVDSPLSFPRTVSIVAMWSDPSNAARICKFAKMTKIRSNLLAKTLDEILAFTFAEWRAWGRRKALDRIPPESSCIPTSCPWCSPASRRPFAAWAHSRACNCLDTRFSWTRSSGNCTATDIGDRSFSLSWGMRVLTCRIACSDSCSDDSTVGPCWNLNKLLGTANK